MGVKVKVRVGGLVDSTIWEVTSQLPTFGESSQPLLVAGQMFGGDGNAAQFDFHVEDRVGEIPRADLTKNLASHNVVTITEDATGTEYWTARGRIADKGISRGAQPWGDYRYFVVTVDDGNIDFRGLALTAAWVRPEETGRARVLAALAAFCNGSPRLTTVIASHLVAAGGEVTMPAHTYAAGTDLPEVFRDCAEVEGKEWGAVIHHAGGSHLCLLYATEDDHTIYPCTLSITDDGPDYVTSFPPIWDQGDAAIESGGDNPISHLVSRYGVEDDGFVVASNTDRIEAYDYWAVPFNDSLSETPAQAATRANAKVGSRGREHVTHQVSIQIPATKVHLVEAGMSIAMKSAASMGGHHLGTTQTRRIAQAKKERVSVGDEGYYLVHLQLDRPEKQMGEKVGAPVGPKPAPVDTPPTDPVAPTPQTSAWSTNDLQQTITDGVVSTWTPTPNNTARAGIVKSTFEGIGGGCPIGSGPWSGQEDRLAGHSFLLNSAGGTIDHGVLTYPWSYDGKGTQYGPFNVYAVPNVTQPPAFDAIDGGTLIGTFSGGSGSTPASGVETFTIPGALLAVSQRLLIIVKPAWTTSGTVCAGSGADGRTGAMPGTGQIVEATGDTASIALFADAGSEATPLIPGEVVPATEFGQAPTAGTSGDYMRGDASAGTPALGGVSTVPIDPDNPPDVGDIMVVTSAPTSTTAVAAWKPNLASSVTVADEDDRFTGDNVEAALMELAALSDSSASDWFNVTHALYGAAGDGTADDTAEIQAAVDACIAAGGGVVYFPAGTYRISSAITVTATSGVRVILRGAGKWVSIVAQQTANTSGFSFNDASDLSSVEDLGIHGPTGNTSGAALLTTKALHIANIRAVGFFRGISLGSGSYYSKISMSYVYDADETGIYLTNGSNNTDIFGTYVHTCPTGIRVVGSEKVSIVGGSVEGSTTYGIRVDSASNNSGGITLNGMYFENGSGATDIAIGTINDTVRGGVIFGNKFTNGVTRHIDIQYAEAFTIGGNDFRDTGSTVRIQDPATGIVLLPNRNDGSYTVNAGTTVIPDDIGGSPAAVDVSITDAGGHYAGSNVEAALQEIGADLAAGVVSSGHYEVVVTANPATAVTTPDGTDWVYGWISD